MENQKSAIIFIFLLSIFCQFSFGCKSADREQQGAKANSWFDRKASTEIKLPLTNETIDTHTYRLNPATTEQVMKARSKTAKDSAVIALQLIHNLDISEAIAIRQYTLDDFKLFRDATSEIEIGGLFAAKWLTIYGKERSRYRTLSIVKIAPERMHCSNADCTEKAILINSGEKTTAAGVNGTLVENTSINTADLVAKNSGAVGVATENAKLFSLTFDRMANEKTGDVVLSGYVNVADVADCEK